jgi:hypothetical protein
MYEVGYEDALLLYGSSEITPFMLYSFAVAGQCSFSFSLFYLSVLVPLLVHQN